MRRINEEHEEEVNGPKPRNPTSMELLQARSVIAHEKGSWKEVKQVERIISWKQSVCSATRKHKNQRKKDMRQCIAGKLRKPWRKRDPPSDDESRGGGALPAYEVASATNTS